MRVFQSWMLQMLCVESDAIPYTIGLRSNPLISDTRNFHKIWNLDSSDRGEMGCIVVREKRNDIQDLIGNFLREFSF